jgi:hypothetical protein
MLDSESDLPPPTELSQRRGPRFAGTSKERLKTMRLSLIEGSFAMVMVTMLEAFYIPYFNAMGQAHARSTLLPVCPR